MHKTIRIIALSILATMLLFALLSWPLPRFITSGIPASAHNIEQPAWRYGIFGDHLQYLYRFDLMSDMLQGRIPWFHNPYEFNTGNDADRYRPDAYFFPLSVLYAMLKPFTGQALGWNLVMWLSVWLSALFAWLWLRRFTRDRAALLIGIGFSLLVPFRWTALFGGSPSGHVLMWLPLLAWAIDVAVREATWASGGWIGLALLMCFFGDLQGFYFAVLAIPVFFMLSLYGHADMKIPWKQWYRVLPLGLLSAILLTGYYLWRRGMLSSASVVREGRGWRELSIYSPSLRGLWTARAGIDGTFYLGWFALLAVAIAALHVIWKWTRNRDMDTRRLILFACCIIVFGATILLGLGANGPRNGMAIRIVRAIIPGYDMIRQPTKIFALMPMWLAWLMAIGWTRCEYQQTAYRLMRGTCIALLLLGSTVEVARAIRVTVSLMEPGQPAYAAIAKDARTRDAEPGRLLSVPLWPGDTADTSLPVHWAQRYGLRLLNGYSAATPEEYVQNVFRRFQSVNQGLLTDEQITDLLQMGIQYLIVNENMFPEKVSPFPVQTTLTRLSANPHIFPLIQDGPVHAFRIKAAARDVPTQPALAQSMPAFPSRRWFLSREDAEHGKLIDNDQSVLGQALRLTADNGGSVHLRPTRLAPRQDLKWWVRVKGNGSMRAATRWSNQLAAHKEIQVDSPEWKWMLIPLEGAADYQQVALEIDVMQGVIDFDIVVLGDNHWPREWMPGETYTIPAAYFFHAGYRDTDGTSIVFRKSHEPADIIFYGPGLPLPPGEYRIEPIVSIKEKYNAEKPVLAAFRMRTRGGTPSPWHSITDAKKTTIDWYCADNRPFVFELKYTRQADIRIHAVRITPLAQ